jgi:hypothetical protein
VARPGRYRDRIAYIRPTPRCSPPDIASGLDARLHRSRATSSPPLDDRSSGTATRASKLSKSRSSFWRGEPIAAEACRTGTERTSRAPIAGSRLRMRLAPGRQHDSKRMRPPARWLAVIPAAIPRASLRLALLRGIRRSRCVRSPSRLRPPATLVPPAGVAIHHQWHRTGHAARGCGESCNRCTGSEAQTRTRCGGL